MTALPDLEQLLEAWPIETPKSITRPITGAINTTIIIQTEHRRFILRAYRRTDHAWIEREHALLTFVNQHRIPAPAPIELRTGGTILECQQRYYALFPFASGEQASAATICDQQIIAMGQCLGRMHTILANAPTALAQPRSIEIGQSNILAEIAQYIELIETLPNPIPNDLHALLRLRGQRSWIEAHPEATTAPLRTLERQIIHGDYTLTNLFFENNQVSAVFDWEQAYCAPRVWEIVRTIDLVWGFDPQASRLFLNGYHTSATLDERDLDLAFECYTAGRAHDLWMYAAIYNDSNERVRAFIEPGGFMPHDQRWRALRQYWNE